MMIIRSIYIALYTRIVSLHSCLFDICTCEMALRTRRSKYVVRNHFNGQVYLRIDQD